jgi:hypothetical protein
MMPHLLLYVALLDRGSAHEHAPVAAIAYSKPGPELLRAAYRDVNLRTARVRDIDAAAVAPDLVMLYAALHAPNDLPGSELVTMRRRVERRLELVRDRLRRDLYESRQSEERNARRSRSRDGAGASAFGTGFPGQAAEQQNAQALIDLITNTIEPDSWETNGGRGRIIYFSPLRVLVIRNSQDVHEQIGGALGVIE